MLAVFADRGNGVPSRLRYVKDDVSRPSLVGSEEGVTWDEGKGERGASSCRSLVSVPLESASEEDPLPWIPREETGNSTGLR